MMRAYRMLALTALAAALVLTAVARLPRRTAPPPAAAAAPAPRRALAIELQGGAVSPEATEVRKGERVRLSVRNAGAAPVGFALAGYQDRVAAAIAPGATWVAEFDADRPGSDFAWMVDGRPAGRFAVAGSHLVEGHR